MCIHTIHWVTGHSTLHHARAVVRRVIFSGPLTPSTLRVRSRATVVLRPATPLGAVVGDAVRHVHHEAVELLQMLLGAMDCRLAVEQQIAVQQ